MHALGRAGAPFTMLIHYLGRDWPLAVLAKEHGIDRRTLHCRLQRGLSIEIALHTPVRSYPVGVLRPRDTKHKLAQFNLCDRCGGDQVVRVLPVGDAWMLCRRCRDSLISVVKVWVRPYQRATAGETP